MLTFDLETAPQLRYVDPTDMGVEWDEKWQLELKENADGLQTTVNAEIAAGNGIVKATGTQPGLHPTTMHIVAASFGGTTKERGDTVDVKTLRDYGTSDNYDDLIDERAEVGLLQTCLDRIAWATRDKPPLVTFNGKSADCWWLLVRAQILQLEAKQPPRSKINWRDVFYPYAHSTHLDLRLYFGNTDRRARGKLGWWADAFGVHSEEQGSEVWTMVRESKWDLLKSYGTQEGHTLIQLYNRVKEWL